MPLSPSGLGAATPHARQARDTACSEEHRIRRKLRELRWLKRKLEAEAQVITEGVGELEEGWVPILAEVLRARMSEAMQASPGASITATFSVDLSRSLPDHPVLWALDSLIIDVKRFLTHSLHLLDMAIHDRDEVSGLSLDKFLNHVLEPKPGATASKLAAAVIADHEDLVTWLRNNAEALRALRHRRTVLEHFRIDLSLEAATVLAHWEADEEPMEDLPSDLGYGSLLCVGEHSLIDFARHQVYLADQFGLSCLAAARAAMDADWPGRS